VNVVSNRRTSGLSSFELLQRLLWKKKQEADGSNDSSSILYVI
jgi:hypothetical protein